MNINFSDESIEDMNAIYRYYFHEAGKEVAFKIISGIIDSVYRLKKFPRSGQKELQFASRGLGHRYIVSGNYKSIYYVKEQDINVVSVFDCRQNPNKMDLI